MKKVLLVLILSAICAMNVFAEYVEWQKVTDNASFGKIEKFGLSYESQHILLSGGVVNNSYIQHLIFF